MDNNDNNQDGRFFYNVKSEDGNIKIEKTSVNSSIESNFHVGEKVSASEIGPVNETPNNSIIEQPSRGDIPGMQKNESSYTENKTSFVNDSVTTNVAGNKTYRSYSYEKSPKRRSPFKYALIAIIIVAVLVGVTMGASKFFSRGPKKNRTFMIYMVGSDLESSGGFATFDLNDVIDSSIDLKNNNVLLIIGGSKKWHNFVNADEIGLYKLGDKGFEKIKNYPLSTMGSNELLTTFLNYSYMKYPAEHYDLIFWNHGLGSVGLEDDEVSEDFMDIQELNQAFKNSYFKKEKLELVIFNNCLSGNIHFADVMSKYANYMVGSEEVMYVSSLIDRLNFIEKVKIKDDGYDIGKYYVDNSDASMKALNNVYNDMYDSTLSIIDLSKVSKLNDSVNTFFAALDLDKDYTSISRARMRLHTYSGDVGYMYDTVDLYELVEALEPYVSDKSVVSAVKSNLESAVLYNSSFNSYSNGLSIYFPFYGNVNTVESHLYYFEKIWNNSYLKFINNYFQTNSNKRKAIRANTGSSINKLANSILVDGNNVSLLLTDQEKENYQRSNIYLFNKIDDSYDLVLKSDKVVLNENVLSFNYEGSLKLNDEYISLFDDDKTTINTNIGGSYAITDVSLDNGISLKKSMYYTDEKPVMGIVDADDTPDILYRNRYSLFNNGELIEDWYDNFTREEIRYDSSTNVLDYTLNDLSEYYIMIEVYDLNNDTFYVYL